MKSARQAAEEHVREAGGEIYPISGGCLRGEEAIQHVQINIEFIRKQKKEAKAYKKETGYDWPYAWTGYVGDPKHQANVRRFERWRRRR